MSSIWIFNIPSERTKLKDTEYPLVSRLLHGPCEKIARIFIMEKDLGEEITYDVSIYVHFPWHILNDISRCYQV